MVLANLNVCRLFQLYQTVMKALMEPPAIRLSKDGKYLYASNRGHDSIAVYTIPGR